MLTVDLVQTLDRLPRADQKVVARSQRLELGGPATNAARTAAALGLRPLLVAPFGAGPLTAFVRRQLAADGVDWLDPLTGQENPAPLSSVLVTLSTGERAVVSGGAPLVPAQWRLGSAADGAAAVLVDGHGGSLPARVAAAGRAHGIPVLLDGGSYKDGMTRYLSDIDLAVLSADFTPPEGGPPLDWALRQGVGAAARSAGAGPIRLRRQGIDQEVAVPEVAVVDTNGAGDVLHGAALAALAATGRAPNRYAEVLAFAARVASASVGFAGALGWAADDGLRVALRSDLRALGVACAAQQTGGRRGGGGGPGGCAGGPGGGGGWLGVRC